MEQILKIPAKDMIDKPSLEDEFRMAIGVFFEETAKMNNALNQIEKRLEELETWKRKQINQVAISAPQP